MNENQGSQGPKQKIVEKIKDSSNILVTVSKNPNVDELAAALGLTLMLDELNKHPTAVVSGSVPAAITFLDPEKTFENTVDSLRDFIIALDKEKADHLRYKVEGDVVKIFITPYRTTITDLDLAFSQGDYNVELVLALGVDSQDNLDAALSAHGKIFHDATVASLSVGNDKSDLGSINWHESGASSVSEMLVALSEAIKSDKPLLTEQVATAFLTGIVAATDRFSNEKTSSKVMTMAAQLMAAGANQQLIAAKLEENDAISHENTSDDANDSAPEPVEQAPEPEAPAAGTLAISHEKKGDLDEVAKQTQAENQAEAAEQAENSLAEQLKTVAPVAPQAPVTEKELDDEIDRPSMGGTLNATTEEAADMKRREEESDRNKTILTHGAAGGYVGGTVSASAYDTPLNAAMKTDSDEPDAVDIFSQPTANEQMPEEKPGIAPEITPPTMDAPAVAPESAPELPPLPQATTQPFETLADIDRKNRTDQHADAQAAVAAAFAEPSQAPVDMPAPVLPDMAPVAPQADIPPVAPAPAAPPLPDFSSMPQPELPPLPQFGPPSGAVHPDQLGQMFNAPAAPPDAQASEASDPSQFKIPGQ